MKRITPFVVFLLLCSCSSPTGNNDPAPIPSALVTLERAEQGEVDRSVTLYGVTQSGASSLQVLSSPAEAVVQRITASVGENVSRNQIVAQLAAGPTTRLDIAKAAAESSAADTAYARARRLRTDGLLGDADVEAARAAAKSADATRVSLGGRAAGMTLRASAAGHVDSIAVHPGDLVQAGTPVITVAREGDLRAEFGADPAIARSLHAGSVLTIAATTGHAAIEVTISSVNPRVDPQTRLASIYAPLPAAEGLAVGETVQGRVAISTRQGSAVTIPYAALLDDGGQPYVFVVAGDVAHRHDVTVAAVSGQRAAIDTGVATGDMVVTEGGTALEDGMKVRIQ